MEIIKFQLEKIDDVQLRRVSTTGSGLNYNCSQT